MANPRKFSEKIAMHAQKQAEGTAAFEAILKEVSATTRGVLAKKSLSNQTLTTPVTPPYIPPKKALSSLENMKHEAMGRASSSGGSRCVEKIIQRGQAERSSSQPRKHFSLTRHGYLTNYYYHLKILEHNANITHIA
ncbi:hypothetical protein HELRODRAFT_171156 [Helobdella robusta]|uniref:Transducer of regulated CREB activity N-terminal domain-containing protein n=1 Tax=Helobdella robusta TaxID=6412 RepID=T1F3V8_HELRO|nr:hypothetical protein HELRODRAFT_171156 [Helobdella robusta]ESO05518.1 hypothetical protein HELRODRAFT_171156 [Helobdella robusta]